MNMFLITLRIISQINIKCKHWVLFSIKKYKKNLSYFNKMPSLNVTMAFFSQLVKFVALFNYVVNHCQLWNFEHSFESQILIFSEDFFFLSCTFRLFGIEFHARWQLIWIFSTHVPYKTFLLTNLRAGCSNISFKFSLFGWLLRV